MSNVPHHKVTSTATAFTATFADPDASVADADINRSLTDEEQEEHRNVCTQNTILFFPSHFRLPHLSLSKT